MGNPKNSDMFRSNLMTEKKQQHHTSTPCISGVQFQNMENPYMCSQAKRKLA